MEIYSVGIDLLLWSLVGLSLLVRWLPIAVDFQRSDFRGNNEKLIWVSVAVLCHSWVQFCILSLAGTI
jgi:hypothetical protein